MLQPFKRTILRIHCWRDRKREKTQTLFQSVFVICRSHSFIYDKNVWISIEWLSSAVRQKFVKSCEAAKICFQKKLFYPIIPPKSYSKILAGKVFAEVEKFGRNHFGEKFSAGSFGKTFGAKFFGLEKKPARFFTNRKWLFLTDLKRCCARNVKPA